MRPLRTGLSTRSPARGTIAASTALSGAPSTVAHVRTHIAASGTRAFPLRRGLQRDCESVDLALWLRSTINLDSQRSSEPSLCTRHCPGPTEERESRPTPSPDRESTRCPELRHEKTPLRCRPLDTHSPTPHGSS